MGATLVSVALFLPPLSTPSRPSLLRRRFLPLRRSFSRMIPPPAASAVETMPDLILDERVSYKRDVLACPICYDPLIPKSDRSSTIFQCQTCMKTYSNNEVFLDLTITTGMKEYGEVKPLATELFRSPLVSFLYERGWRQSFILGGFPGPEEEFEMAKTYLEPTLGGTLVDASCGSGLFSRLFAKSGMYSLVVAMDFSENMLRQCYEFIQQDTFLTENLMLVRADISRIPFVSSSVDAVHAGAALQCWPSPSTAVAEISRILKPGGVFVATTFALDGIFPIVPVMRTLRQFVAQTTSNHFFFQRELEDLCMACGFVDIQYVKNGSFIMISATKPSSSLLDGKERGERHVDTMNIPLERV